MFALSMTLGQLDQSAAIMYSFGFVHVADAFCTTTDDIQLISRHAHCQRNNPRVTTLYHHGFDETVRVDESRKS